MRECSAGLSPARQVDIGIDPALADGRNVNGVTTAAGSWRRSRAEVGQEGEGMPLPTLGRHRRDRSCGRAEERRHAPTIEAGGVIRTDQHFRDLTRRR
jgi:hypothetical protein